MLIVKASELGRAGWLEIAGGGSRKLRLWSEEQAGTEGGCGLRGSRDQIPGLCPQEQEELFETNSVSW